MKDTMQQGKFMERRLDRRRFLQGALAAAGWALAGRLGPATAWAYSNYRTDQRETAKRFAFAQLHYQGGDWDPEPTAISPFLVELERMTSIEALFNRVELTLDSPDLFSHPFLFMAGHGEFEPFTGTRSNRLRTWIEAGGTLIADDSAGTPGYGFNLAFRREMARIFSDSRLERLPVDHTVFKSFFLVRSVGGRQSVSPFLEGITVQGRTVVIFSQNDLLGAWARDPIGRWIHPCVPGGERQRRQAFHLGINIVMYALCADYKQDRIHVPFLRQRI